MILWDVLTLDAIILAAGYWIATHYPRFYQYWCQMKEPFTRWVSRFAEAHGRLWWGIETVLTLASFTGILLLRWEWRVLDAAFFGFQCWFVFHIRDYILDHYPDNPPVGFRMFACGLTVRQQTAQDVWNMVVDALPTGTITAWSLIEAIHKVGKAIDAKYKI